MSPASETRLQRHLQLGLKIKVATDESMESDSRCSFEWTLSRIHLVFVRLLTSGLRQFTFHHANRRPP